MRSGRVKPGDRIAVVAPSSPLEGDGLARGLSWLRERYRVDNDARWHLRDGFLAGDDRARADALLHALREPDVRAVLAARGGHGALRVLEVARQAIIEALRRDPKPLLGYSDVTALHAVWARAGVCSVHASMVTSLADDDTDASVRDEVLSVLEGAMPRAWEGLEVLCKGEARGRAMGGNLAVILALLATPCAMPLDGAVLFLEDVGERPYRVDRMLTTLRMSGALDHVRAVVLGEFTECAAGPDGVTVEQVLRERLGTLGIPVVAGAAFGHGNGERVIPLGAVARVAANGRVDFEDE